MLSPLKDEKACHHMEEYLVPTHVHKLGGKAGGWLADVPHWWQHLHGRHT